MSLPANLSPGERDHLLAIGHHGSRYTAKERDEHGAGLLRASAVRLDKVNARARTQPTYSHSEQSALDHWRARTTQLVHDRISLYRDLSLHENPGAPESSHRTAPNTTDTPSHRALAIPEILNQVLEYAGAQSHLTARSVSRTWRRSAISPSLAVDVDWPSGMLAESLWSMLSRYRWAVYLRLEQVRRRLRHSTRKLVQT
jgi:hypothetical protein